MNYLKGTLIILVSTYFILYQAYSQVKQPQQKGIISTKTVVLKFENQTDTLKIPVASDQYPALKKALSYKNIFDGDDLSDVVKKYQSCGCGITRVDYEITFENKDIVSLIIYFDTMNAYPDDYQKFLTFNINTGELYPIKNEINPKGLKWIYDNYKATLSKRIAADKEENADENDEGYNTLKTTIDSLTSDELFEKYVFTKTGLMLSIDKILPHVIQASEPDRDYTIPFNKLKTYKTPTAVVLK
jgi:hypothetical protein